ncbi:uncharacterized protein FRV6_16545 [Fusarium oxysporum]|uniref:Uncharacterized protein n=1 Tax=Fusarium oxysporum TaxID=5507 RepID=A0A2H3TUY9_FUSOX|nr:uncharacterized protein FRV6_16545 [Fusarium oxysporum]
MAEKTYVFGHIDDKWGRSVAKEVRPISTVILDDRIKERASCFGLSNYAVTLSVGDGCLKTLFAELPGLRNILLEDVDVVKVARGHALSVYSSRQSSAKSSNSSWPPPT